MLLSIIKCMTSCFLAAVAPELDFAGDESYIEWELTDPGLVNTTNGYALAVDLLFRTRTDSGLLFTAASFSRLEHLKIDVSAQHLRL